MEPGLSSPPADTLATGRAAIRPADEANKGLGRCGVKRGQGVHAGKARSAVAAIACRSLRLAPPVACTDMPCMTVATKLASAAGSASAGRSPSLFARFRRSRIATSPAARRDARTCLTDSHSSPPQSAPCTMRQPVGVRLSLKRSAVLHGFARRWGSESLREERVSACFVTFWRLLEQRLLVAQGRVEARRTVNTVQPDPISTPT